VETRRVVLRYPRQLLDRPITSQLIRDFHLEFNILRADVTQDSEGLLVMGLTGTKGNLDKGLRWAREQGVSVQPLSKEVVRNEKVCTHCGACINVCPTDALVIDAETREVQFNSNRCIACELCVAACPYRAMEVAF